MLSADHRYSIVFNGEIYNYRELRRELAALGHLFVSDSDTEVLLAAWQQWGAQCLPMLIGMFAFVIYDSREKTLSCARDAFGIKPFYYEQSKGRFLFASELPALLCLRHEKPEPDLQRCYDYLVNGDTESGRSSFVRGVEHLQPGCWLEIHLAGQCAYPAEQQRWWHPVHEENRHCSFDQAAEAVREHFLQNIKLHLRSDVPLGACLSGGIDSSAIVCAMRHVEPDLPINTFSFIAPGYARSEEQWANRIIDHVGAISHKITADGPGLVRDLDRLVQAQGEPFGSTNVYAHYMVCERIREKGITVTLEGQGADELLAGYTGYPGYRMLSLLERGNLLGAQRFAANWGKWPGRSRNLAWINFARAALPERGYHLARSAFGSSFRPEWLKTDMMIEGGVKPAFNRERRDQSFKGRRVIEQQIYALRSRALPSLLRHGDRSAMWFSVESRLPFLTVPLANLLLSMPEQYLISDTGETKSVFRAAMRGIVPDEVLDRRDKIGFDAPEQSWMMAEDSPARDWLRASHKIPFLNQKAMLERFDAVASGKAAYSWQIWRWVNFVRWYEQLGMA
jgi:asparagine synthase (glutamine-hydrolysing)